MEKILIIAYFFPPCNLTASQRAYGWANHLKEFGYYPIIITRSWDHEIKLPTDAYKKSGSTINHEKFENYEVYYLPYHPNLRDKIYTKYADSKLGFIRKALTFAELFMQNLTNYLIPFKNIYDFSEEYLKKNRDIQKVIITANPFILFKFGYLLNKRLKIKWIADYRDDWNTQQLITNKPFVHRLLSRIESRSEKKWVSSSESITSISNYYVEKISKFLKKPGNTILNGYSDEGLNKDKMELFNDFTILYSGTLYPVQKVEVFLSAVKKFIDHAESKPMIKLYFPGLTFDINQADRVSEFMEGYSEYMEIMDRIPKNKVVEIEKRSHLLLMISYSDLKGIPSSKMYEYISFKKPILVCPSDGDIIESTLKKTGLGYIANTSDEAYELLNKFYLDYSKGRKIPVTPNSEEIETLSRKNQTKKLAKILNSIETQ